MVTAKQTNCLKTEESTKFSTDIKWNKSNLLVGMRKSMSVRFQEGGGGIYVFVHMLSSKDKQCQLFVISNL